MSEERAEIAAIRGRLAGATPGPYSYDDGITDDTTGERGKPCAVYARGAVWVCSPEAEDPEQADADGRFIAHAPTDLAFLLAENERQAAEIAALTAEADDCGRACKALGVVAGQAEQRERDAVVADLRTEADACERTAVGWDEHWQPEAAQAHRRVANALRNAALRYESGAHVAADAAVPR